MQSTTNSLIERKAQQDKRDPSLPTLTVVAFLPPQLNLFVFSVTGRPSSGVGC